MIATWNDFEEGSDIEFGIGDCLLQEQQRSALPGHTVIYTHVLTNTGKFADTFTLNGSSSHDWPLVIMPTSTVLPGYLGTVITLTLTVPASVSGGMHDTLMITATSGLSPSVYSRLINTTAVLWGIYLPIIRREATFVGRARAVHRRQVSHPRRTEAPQLHDGRWLFIKVKTAKDVKDIRQLLQIKRRPKPQR
jgi:hypothetical protein